MTMNSRLAQPARLLMIVGGIGFCLTSDYSIFPTWLFLCVLGLVLTTQSPHPYAFGWKKRIGTICLVGALVGLLIGIIGYHLPPPAFLVQRYNDVGGVIDVLDYPVSYFTDRYGSIPAFLLLGIGLLCLMQAIQVQQGQRCWQRILCLLALLHLLIYCCGVIELYLDGETPGLFIALLWRITGLTWVVMGVLSGTRLHILPTEPRQSHIY